MLYNYLIKIQLKNADFILMINKKLNFQNYEDQLMDLLFLVKCQLKFNYLKKLKI